jgi:hypothetical protein
MALKAEVISGSVEDIPTLRRRSIMRRLYGSAAVLAVSLVFGVGAQADAPKFKAGNWEFVTAKKTSGKDKGRPFTIKKCLTKQDPDPVKQLVERENCKMKSPSMDDDTLRWKAECDFGETGTASGDGEFTVSGATAKGKMKTILVWEGKEIPLETTWTGKRLGDCK